MTSYQGNEPYVFVSYAHADRDRVFPIIELLQDNGYHVWYDEGLHAGNDWRDELADRIRDCRAFLYMRTKNSARSPYCRDEIYAADAEMKRRDSETEEVFDESVLPLLSVQLEEADLSGGLRMIIDTKQVIQGAGVSAENIAKALIESGKLEACRDTFRYVEGENWGPAREGFYFDELPDHPVFNSVVDNPIYGDERHFLSIKGAPRGREGHFVVLQPGMTYTAELFYNNDGDPHLNASGKAVAVEVLAAVKLPETLRAGKPEILQATVGCFNGKPQEVWDQVALYCAEDAVIEYDVASAKIYNYGKLSGEGIGTQLFSEGVCLGFNKFSGKLLGGMQFSGRIEFKFTVKPIRQVAFSQTASVDRRNYGERIAVFPGDEVSCRIELRNDHFDDIEDVTFRTELPEGMELVPGSVVLYAVPFMGGRQLSDHLVSNGINTGLFGEGVTGVIRFRVRVSEAAKPQTELAIKSLLVYTETHRDPKDRYHRVSGEAVYMNAETVCYVHGREEA